MNGKIKTKFAALFAVALMITVCVVPVVDNAGVDAAPVSSTNGEVFEGYDITLYKEGGDYSGLVYYGADPKIAGFTVKTAEDNGGNAYYYNPETEKLLTVDQVPGYVPTQATYGFPMIQFVYSYDDADVNDVNYEVKIKKGTQEYLPLANSYPNGVTLDNDRSQGVLTVQMGTGNNFTHKLGLASEMIAGDFEVVVEATQGVTKQIINETVNAGTAITVSGTIMDASNQPIKAVYSKDGKTFESGMKIDLRVNGSIVANWVPTDVNGRYSYNVAAGNTVSVAGISYFIDDDENDGAYTFETETYDFGTISGSDAKDFTAKEYTGSFKVQSANGISISGFDSNVALVWMYQTGTANIDNSVTYTVNTTPGNYEGADVGLLNDVTDADGKIYFTYVKPKLTQGATKGNYDSQKLIINSINTSALYSFGINGSYNWTDKTLDEQIASKKTIDVLSSNATINAVESTGTITITSKNGIPLMGETVSLNWYYEYKDGSNPVTADSLPTSVTPTVNESVKQTVNSVSDANGMIVFSYVAPVLPAGYSATLVVSGVNDIVATATTLQYDIATIATDKTIDSSISGKTGTSKVSNGTATIKALDNVWKVSGTYGKNADMNVTNNVTPATVKSDKDGKYTYYVKEGVSSVITATGYVPSTYTTPSMSKDIAVNFVKYVAPEENLPVTYKVVDGPAQITYTYSINGEKATTVGGASITLKAPVGSEITISAVAEGCEISAFDGYSAKAVAMKDYYFIVEDGTNVISGATFDITYTYSNKQETISVTADNDGIAKFSIPNSASNIIASKDGKYVEYTSDSFRVGLELVSGWSIDLGEYYGDASATVSIVYGAVYNVEDVSYGPVAYEFFVGTATSKTVVKSIALKAPSIDNFEFVAWMVDGVVVSESADYTLVVEDGEEYNAVALYSAVHYEEPAEGLSMNVLVIGIVILILGILAVAYGIISKKQ